MSIRFSNVFFIIISFTLLFSCDSKEESEGCVYQPDISDIEVDLNYVSLTNEFLDIKSPEELAGFFSDHPVIAHYFFRKFESRNDQEFYEKVLNKITNPHIDSLQMEVNRVFNDEEQLKEEFETAFKHLKYYYPDVQIPRIKTIATGFEQDMYVSDSLIIVGLDYYLGEGAKYRPLDMYQYLLRRYSPDYVVPSVMLIYGISPRFNQTDISDKTVLAEMVAYGKAFYFAKHMIPCKPDSILIWYSDEEISGAQNNVDIIWTHFVENQILYETSHEVKRKYIEERPKTVEIGNAAPGRIGTWLGWQIVRSYMRKNENITFPELMATENPQEIFKDSKYRPK